MINSELVRQQVSYKDPVKTRLSFLGFQIVLLVLLQWQATSAFTHLAVIYLPATFTQRGWHYGYTGHFIQCAVALGIIAILKPFFSGSFGLRMPQGKSFVWPALWIGGLAGFPMLLVDYYPQLLTLHAPPGPYSTNLGNMVPWLTMQGIFVGITEEIPFRSLFLGYMLQRYPKTLRAGRFEISWAGVLMAVVFAFGHADAFWHEPFVSAIGQQVYVFLYGIFFAYLFEQSGSVLAPIIAHNASDFVEWGLCFFLRALWK